MATKKEITEFETALKNLHSARPDLGQRLGSSPSRAQLLETLAEFFPEVAQGMTAASRFSLVKALAALVPAPQAEPLQSFTTRLPASLVSEVKTTAASRPGGVQALVKEALETFLKS